MARALLAILLAAVATPAALHGSSLTPLQALAVFPVVALAVWVVIGKLRLNPKL